MLKRVVVLCTLVLLFRPDVFGQPTPPSGSIKIKLVRAVDSSTMRAGQGIAGSVVESENGSVQAGSGAAIQLVASPSGGFSLQLARISVNGQMFATTSSAGVLVNGTVAGGPALSLPPGTVISFTLGTASARGAARQVPPSAVGRTAAAEPRHPANTVRDVPAAAPGFPALHASRDAQPGCWWKPFFSKKYGFEAAVQECEEKAQRIPVVELDNGLAFVLHSDQKPENFLEVRTKPADQPIEDAIKEQFIMKLKVPAARTSCKVKRADYGAVPTYSIVATGPYSKLKKFQSEDSPDVPCPGLMTNDAVAVQFVYIPTESKTSFFFTYTEDYGIYFDEGSIRFPTQP